MGDKGTERGELRDEPDRVFYISLVQGFVEGEEGAEARSRRVWRRPSSRARGAEAIVGRRAGLQGIAEPPERRDG